MVEPLRAIAIAGVVWTLGLASAMANPLQVTVDTSQLVGIDAALAFDFIEGGPPGNVVTITGFTTDGTLGAITLNGDANGALPGPVTLGDTGFFNEYLQLIALGTSISFTFDTTGQSPADEFAIPDGFSFFLIDPSTNLSLIETSDPTGANALLLYSVGVAQPLAVYGGDRVTVITGTVPEPGSASLAVLALLMAMWFARLRRRPPCRLHGRLTTPALVARAQRWQDGCRSHAGGARPG